MLERVAVGILCGTVRVRSPCRRARRRDQRTQPDQETLGVPLSVSGSTLAGRFEVRVASSTTKSIAISAGLVPLKVRRWTSREHSARRSRPRSRARARCPEDSPRARPRLLHFFVDVETRCCVDTAPISGPAALKRRVRAVVVEVAKRLSRELAPAILLRPTKVVAKVVSLARFESERAPDRIVSPSGLRIAATVAAPRRASSGLPLIAVHRERWCGGGPCGWCPCGAYGG